MLELENIDIATFKKEIYSGYKIMFPRLERKSYKKLKKCNKLGINHFIKIVEDNKIIGFMIINIVNGIKYVQLDYFAIFPQYQDKGYGTRVLEMLQEGLRDFELIFIETETIGKGKNEEDNKQRIRRDKFYKNANFIPLNYEFYLYKVIYTPYILYTNEECEHKEEQEIVDKIFEIYRKTIGQSGERKFNKNCNYRPLK